MTAAQIARLVEAAGGQYRGIQLGTARIPDQVLFNDPETHTTLAVPMATLCRERVELELHLSREKWARAKWVEKVSK